MKLLQHFYTSFFYIFFMGIILNFISIIIFSIFFTNKYIDKITGENIIQLEKKISKINLNSINVLITTSLAKIQSSLNELIIAYQKSARIIKEGKNTNYNISNKFFKGLLDLTPDFLEQNLNNLEYIAYWVIDENTNETNLKSNSIEEKQIYAFSNIIQNLFSTFTATNSSSICYYFYFDASELFISYPLIYDYESEFLEVILNYEEDNPRWCTDENGQVYKTYKAKCRDYYINIQKAKTSSFDNNSLDNKNRTIFVTEFYQDLSQPKSANIYSMCIQFLDPISEKNAIACADIGQDNLINNFDDINSKLSGYFLVSLIGFNHLFYFPLMLENALTPSEAIFSSNKNFFIEEKNYFKNVVEKIMTSNYIKYIGEFIWDEIYIDKEQFFYFNGEKNYFSIIPVILENLKGEKEHILSIVYVYKFSNYYERLFLLGNNNIYMKIILVIIFFIIIGSGLLYLIFLSFEFLGKYITIPIKNVNYMLKGINIGGNNRLEYLEFLQERQEEISEILEKQNINDNYNNKENNENESIDENIDNTINDCNNNDYELNEKNSELNIKEEDHNGDNMIINQRIDSNKKYEEEIDYISKEIIFYNFDENLLQYRSLEIDHLLKSLLDLKKSLILTSDNQKKDKIINYSNSSKIFQDFKNNEAMKICQRNIGNLQMQLHKYDKAIYHLVSSLQDKKLKKLFDKNLSDELDKNDTLLNMMKNMFADYDNKEKNKFNKLVKKQLNEQKKFFSQKNLGNLINSRYNLLIKCYFKFFRLIQKFKSKELIGKFTNTSFHTVNYFNKVLIQYIYLSYVKNDLIKIGESILDYIEFLLKFKFKTSPENIYLLNIHNYYKKDKNNSEKEKESYKRKIFDKILNWFCLFDDYVSHVRKNTTLSDNESLLNDKINLNIETNLGSQSSFLFKVNLQRSEFLKGKFALYCKNYNDALFYFIRASKKYSIVLDGLIMKKAMKNILKILNIFLYKYDELEIMGKNLGEKILEYEKVKYKNKLEKNLSNNINFYKNNNSFGKELKKIKNYITEEINKYNSKKEKDVIILIDFNIYNFNDGIINEDNLSKINSFIEQSKEILNNHLSNNDRLSAFIYKDQHKMICPLINKNDIDINNFYQDLLFYRNSIYYPKEAETLTEKENSLYDIDNENMNIQKNYSSKESEQDSLYNIESNNSNNTNNIKGLISSINYIEKYLCTKQNENKENYIILFTDLFSIYKISDENIKKNFEMINENKEIILLFVGKEINGEKDRYEDEDILDNIIKNKFSEKSEIIVFENMKKIGKILMNNFEIKDEIVYPNEIYKY